MEQEQPDGSDVGVSGSICVLHSRSKYIIPLPTSIGKLREDVHAATDVPPERQVILAGGRKITPSTPNDTALDQYKLRDGSKLMLSVLRSDESPGIKASHPSVHSEPDSNLNKVRQLDRTVATLETEIVSVEARVEKISRGFLSKEQTEDVVKRVERDKQEVEERLMQALTAADAVCSANTPQQDGRTEAQWRSERKALVLRSQAALRRCDEVQRRLKEMLEDEYGEMAWRRGRDE